jgi:hypothetical protein
MPYRAPVLFALAAVTTVSCKTDNKPTPPSQPSNVASAPIAAPAPQQVPTSSGPPNVPDAVLPKDIPTAPFGKQAKLADDDLKRVRETADKLPACLGSNIPTETLAVSDGKTVFVAAVCGQTQKGDYPVSMWWLDDHNPQLIGASVLTGDSVGLLQFASGVDDQGGPLVCVEWYRSVGVKNTKGHFACFARGG